MHQGAQLATLGFVLAGFLTSGASADDSIVARESGRSALFSPHATSDPDEGGGRPIARAAWAWKPALWRTRPQVLLHHARALGLDRLFVAVDIKEGRIADEDAFARFVAQARRADVAIAVVEGDPSMALGAGRAAALDRLNVLARYQDRAEPEGRIIGVQYDIEPYLLPSYAHDPEHVLKGWAETIEALGRATALELDIVLPFWLPDNAIAARLVLPALRRANRVTVMAYRTNEAELLAAAKPLLAWGARVAIPVHIAVEVGPLNTASAGRVSFLGDVKRAHRVVEASVMAFRTWPSFAGLAFHGVIE